MTLAGTEGQGLDQQCGEGTGHGRRVWRWCEYKRVNERGTHCSSAPLSHTTHTFRDQRARSPQERLNIGNKVSHWGWAQDEEEGPHLEVV